MRVTFAIPGYLRSFADGRDRVELDLEARTVGQALSSLFAKYPGMRDRILTEQGQVRPHVNVFVGDESIRYLGGLEAPLPSGAQITLLPAVSGGVDLAPSIAEASRPFG
jgi:molybdopterin converting factor small subunit